MSRSAHHHARFIPSEEIDAQAVRQWQFGDMAHAQSSPEISGIPVLPMLDDLVPPPAPKAQADLPGASSVDVEDEAQASQRAEEEVQALLEQASQQAHEEGFQQGVQQGREQGLQDGKQQATLEWQQKLDDYQAQQGQQVARQLQSVLDAAQRDVQGIQQRMAPDVLQLACDIARQVVRQELRSNPQALLPVVREALDMLSAESKPVCVRLNPADWERLKDTLKTEFPQPKIEWLADASVQPGDCKIESAGAQVDGSLERRWQRAVAALGLVSTWYDGAPAHGQ